jgi:Domain of unknown function (DUF4430)
MKKFGIVLAGTVLLACGAIAPSAFGSKAPASVGPKVSVEVKTLTKTLLGPTTVRGQKGWITKGGAPTGKCSGDSGAGALNAATQGRWTGGYDASLGIFVDSILGVKPPNKNYYWEIFVNNKVANFGVCGLKLKAGEKFLFKIAKG